MSALIYAFCALSLIVFAITIFWQTNFKRARLSSQCFKWLIPIMGLLMICSVLFFSGAVDARGIKALPVLSFLLGLIPVIVHFRAPKSRFWRFFWRTVMVCGILELLVFNFQSTHLLFGAYPQGELAVTDAQTVQNIDVTTGTNTDNGTVMLEWDDINFPVGTLSFDIVSDKKVYSEIHIDFADDTSSDAFREDLIVRRIDSADQTVICNFSGKVHHLRLRYYPMEGEKITLRSVAFNYPRALRFSLMRFLPLVLIACFIWLLATSRLLSRSYQDARVVTDRLIRIVTALLIIAAVLLTDLGSPLNLKHDFRSRSGNQITQELVDAFAQGHLYLNDEVDERLLALENPYDRSQRINAGVDDLYWDHLLYDGKIYSYYGIAPVVLLFLPYHLLTGFYFPTNWAVLLFGCGGIIFLSALYLALVRRFFRDIRASLVLSGLVLLQIVSGVFFCFYNPLFYEIAQSSAFLCVTAGAYFMLTADVIGEGKPKNGRLALSSVFLSLAVLCRPTSALYCVAALLFIYAGWRKRLRAGDGKKSIATYFVAALLPFALIGAAQMLYNYLRFSSPLDFGIAYSLTINDFTRSQFHLQLAGIGYFHYLLMPPALSQYFPFCSMRSVPLFDVSGYYFVATHSTLGIIWKAFPVLAYFRGGQAWRLSRDPQKTLYAVLIVAACVLCPLIAIGSIWESGYGTRYCIDFSWQLLIGALVIAFVLYRYANDTAKRYMNTFFAVSVLIGGYLTFAQIYQWINPFESLPILYQRIFSMIERTMTFWV